MNAHLVKDLDKLKAQILRVAAAVEENVRKSVRALRELSAPLAEDVVYSDRKIDETEVETEEECLKILALHQPVASDLRFVITVLKINNELEHIGDMSANIARRVPFLLRGGKVPHGLHAEKQHRRLFERRRAPCGRRVLGRFHRRRGKPQVLRQRRLRHCGESGGGDGVHKLSSGFKIPRTHRGLVHQHSR